MSFNKKPQKHFDLIVIGAGLSGLIVASVAKKNGLHVALIEAQEKAGGLHYPVTLFSSQQDNTLRLLPASSEAYKLLNLLQNSFDFDFSILKKDEAILTFEEGKLKEFTGFGKTPPLFFEEISPFISPQYLELSTSWHSLVGHLLTYLKDNLYEQHLVSEIIFNEKNCRGIMVNGHHFWESPQVVYAGAITELLNLLPPQEVSPRLKNHLKRPKLWTLLAVDFYHPKVISQNTQRHLLNGTTQDDIGPCLGKFLPCESSVTQTSGQVSQWLSFLSDEESDESENIGAIIKKIKKQIKRAYPESFQEPTRERIVVIPSGAGHFEDAQFKDRAQLKGFENLFIASSHLSPEKGILKPIDQAFALVEILNLNKEKPSLLSEEEQKPLSI